MPRAGDDDTEKVLFSSPSVVRFDLNIGSYNEGFQHRWTRHDLDININVPEPEVRNAQNPVQAGDVRDLVIVPSME